jgi:hypothetical protein
MGQNGCFKVAQAVLIYDVDQTGLYFTHDSGTKNVLIVNGS